jgi:hypothetical protein
MHIRDEDTKIEFASVAAERLADRFFITTPSAIGSPEMSLITGMVWSSLYLP